MSILTMSRDCRCRKTPVRSLEPLHSRQVCNCQGKAMKEITYVFGALEEPDVEALMRIGTRQQLHVGDKLLTEGTHPDAIYLVLEGKLSVAVKGRDTAIAYVGKGDIVGEMSLLESQPASATVCAITPVTVLRIPRDALEENLAADPGFSLRFYRALAMLLSTRLRATTSPASSKLRPPSELVRWAGPDLTDMASLFGAACREYQARPAYRVDGTVDHIRRLRRSCFPYRGVAG